MKKFWIMAVAATVFAGCAKDTTEDVAILPQEGVLRVSIESVDSRVQLAGGETVWNEGDRVSVFYRTTGNERWKFTGATGDTEGVLERMNGEASDTPIDKICAIYPYATRNAVGTDGTFSFPLYVTRTYCKDSYGVGDNVMVASGDSGDLAFRNALGWIKVQLTGAETVKSIELSGNRNEPLAGTVTLNPDLTVSGIADAVSYLTLDCGDGVKLSETPTSFYFAVPPQTFEAGITITVSTASGEEKTEVTCNPISVSRNHIVPMSERGYDDLGKEVPANQIWYTSTDGKAVTPYRSNVFGANIVSNTYADGKGVILFDGPISNIGEKAFWICDKLAGITIPDSVTSIGEYAFYYCSGLTEAVLPGSVTSIGRYAFSGCDGITSVPIPDGVKEIGDYAFFDCDGLVDIVIPESVAKMGYFAFDDCDNMQNMHVSDLTAWCNIDFYYSWGMIGEKKDYNLYVDGELVTDLVIPDGVTVIKGWAFYYFSNITSVIIPDGVTEIGTQVFYDCSGLTKIYIPDSMMKIGGDAFWVNNDNFLEMHISDLAAWCNIEFRYNWIFVNGGYGLYLDGERITDLVIPDGVTSIGKWSFTNCSSLTSITIPDSVTEIGSSAFYGCRGLASVTIPDSVTKIGYNAFYNCSGLTSVTIADSVTEIEKYTFYGCRNLHEIHISDLTAWCNIEFGEKWIVNNEGYDLYLDGEKITDLVIPSGIASIGDYAFSYCTGLTSVTIPDSVTTIGNYAFSGCRGLTSITIPDSVTTIGYGAFSDCSGLASVTIPDSVTTIGSSAFSGCSGLTSVIIPDSVTTIGYGAFSYCSGLASVTIPDSVTTIGDYAFSYCSGLTSITIPDSVTSIGRRGFYKCSALADIYCMAEVPPTLGSEVFTGVPSELKIYVPRASVEAYESAPYWKDYAIAGYDF